jgi:hypothetical protein
MKASAARRRQEAKERQAKRNALTESAQLKNLSQRPGVSFRERARLLKKIERNTVKNLAKEL